MQNIFSNTNPERHIKIYFKKNTLQKYLCHVVCQQAHKCKARFASACLKIKHSVCNMRTCSLGLYGSARLLSQDGTVFLLLPLPVLAADSQCCLGSLSENVLHVLPVLGRTLQIEVSLNLLPSRFTLHAIVHTHTDITQYTIQKSSAGHLATLSQHTHINTYTGVSVYTGNSH